MRHAHKIETATHAANARADRLAVAIPAVLAALLGFFMLYGVGFANIPAVHNATNDARHAFGFPCH